MKPAQFIRDSMAEVGRLRQVTASDGQLQSALLSVKHYQSLRFQHSYRDLIAGGPFQIPARFFLDELYGVVDFSARDAQFSRIAGTVERLLPAAAVSTAVALAKLHVLTEKLDFAMAEAWKSICASATPASRYVAAWQRVGQQEQRLAQLQLVLELGRDLDHLTRKPGLRKILKLMRRPAAAAGMAQLQAFLETGFDAFASMAMRESGVSEFLHTIETRESALITALFAKDFDAARAIADGLLPK